jgi:predicted anti-sigma-YlaC factor YlaD
MLYYKGLLPNYIGQLTSEEINCIIEEHLKTCSNCSKERDEMLERIEMETISQNQNFKKYLGKTKIMY